MIRARSAGVYLMAVGPYFLWAQLDFLERMPGLALQPLRLEFGRQRCRTGFVSRRTAEDLPPFRLLRKAVRGVALGRGS